MGKYKSQNLNTHYSNMKRNFFYFAWREFLRSASKNKNMATKGVLIFFAIYFSLVAFFMGFQLTENLKDLFLYLVQFNQEKHVTRTSVKKKKVFILLS